MAKQVFKGAKYYPSEDKKLGVVLFHAYTGSPNDVNLLARKLHRLGYGVLSPLFKGHGSKDPNDILTADIADWKKNAKEAYEYMVEEYEQVFVFGLSMGGIFATWLMTQTDLAIKSGGVFNSPVVTLKKTDVSESFMNYAGYIYKRFISEEAFQVDKETILASHWQQMKDLEVFKAEIEANLNKITLPFYIAQSSKDELIEFKDAHLLHYKLEKAQVDYHDFPDNTHVITTNRERSDFEDSLIKFLKESAAE